jgi:uncharacterized protein (UPF0332 family)
VTEDNRAHAVKLELRRADEELQAARALVAGALLRPAMTRVYYAAFHAARALLFAKGLEPRSHAGILHLLNVHYIRANHLEPRWSRTLARLQKFREEADYGGEFVLDEDGLAEELQAAEAFCARARSLLAPLAGRDEGGQ